jgi:integrase
MRARITKSIVESVTPGVRDIYLWDDRTPGFGLKVTPRGARIYVLKYRFERAARWVVLGRHGDLTAEQARVKAVKLRGAIANGEDPARSRDERAAELTINELADRYIGEYAKPHKGSRSAEEDERNLKLHIRPELGKLRVGAVTKQDILKLHHKMRETPTAANRVASLLSKMLGLAEEWGMRPEGSNPCRKVKHYEEKSHERFLSGDELKRLGEALDAAEHDAENPEHPHAIAVIKLLVLTGCRRNEILSLKWSYIDFERGTIRLPAKRGVRTVRLAAPALNLLARLPRFAGTEFVFPLARGSSASKEHNRRRGAGHFTAIERAWYRIRTAAGLEDVRLHDLRHTFASWAVSGGASLHMTGNLLGHRRAATTQRYAHLAEDPTQVAAERVAGALAAAMGGKEQAEVVELPRRAK